MLPHVIATGSTPAFQQAAREPELAAPVEPEDQIEREPQALHELKALEWAFKRFLDRLMMGAFFIAFGFAGLFTGYITFHPRERAGYWYLALLITAGAAAAAWGMFRRARRVRGGRKGKKLFRGQWLLVCALVFALASMAGAYAPYAP